MLQHSVAKDEPDCVFPECMDIAAPAWLCSGALEGVEVASFRKTAAGVQFQKAQATADGKTN